MARAIKAALTANTAIHTIMAMARPSRTKKAVDTIRAMVEGARALGRRIQCASISKKSSA